MSPKLSTIALVAAVAISCTAASAFAAATITGAQVKNGSLTGADVKNSSLVGLDVKNGSLGAADLSAAAKAALAGQAGPAGAQGPQGIAGPQGSQGNAAWDVIPSGQTVVGSFVEYRPNDLAGTNMIGINLPGVMGTGVGAGNINAEVHTKAGDGDATCTGTVTEPTAPAGKICVYLGVTTGVADGSVRGYNDTLTKHGFRIGWTSTAVDQVFTGSWAYTPA